MCDSFCAVPATLGPFVLQENIGYGTFATVYKAIHNITKNTVAIKILPKAMIRNERQLTKVIREIKLLNEMDHPLIAKLFAVYEDQMNHYLVMEYSGKGELRDLVMSKGSLSEDKARKYFVQLVSVIEYLHNEKKTFHRDLKAENVLLDKHNNIRLIDFGLSTTFQNDEQQFSSKCGSYQYVSPEMLTHSKYTIATDIWSLGVLLYIMTTGTYPFESDADDEEDDNEVIKNTMMQIISAKLSLPSFLSPALCDLLEKMLNKDPNQRITLEKIKQHPWFSKIEYLSIEEYRKIHNKFDQSIALKMNEMGIDTKNLRKDLFLDIHNDITTMYKILKREKVTEEMKTSLMPSHYSFSMIESQIEISATKKNRSHHRRHHRHQPRSDGSSDDNDRPVSPPERGLVKIRTPHHHHQKKLICV